MSSVKWFAILEYLYFRNTFTLYTGYYNNKLFFILLTPFYHYFYASADLAIYCKKKNENYKNWQTTVLVFSLRVWNLEIRILSFKF